MEKPKLSPQFTIDDIHKLREYNYEIMKNMTWEEQLRYYKESSERVETEIAKHRTKYLTCEANEVE